MPDTCPSCGAALQTEYCPECGWYADSADEPLDESDLWLLTHSLVLAFAHVA